MLLHAVFTTLLMDVTDQPEQPSQSKDEPEFDPSKSKLFICPLVLDQISRNFILFLYGVYNFRFILRVHGNSEDL